MADTAITNTNNVESGEHVGKNQVIIPNYRKATVELADDDYHALIVDGRGKGRMSVFVTNETDTDVAVTVFGAQTSDADPGDTDAVELGGSGESGFTASSTDKNYETYNDPFPFYIIRIKAATDPDGEEVNIYVNFQQQ